jgi:hypothetical protein
MKNLLLGLALVGFAFGCRTDKSTSISDPSSANMPTADCCKETGAECSEKMKAECATKKADCQKTCPMTGKVQG